MVTALEKFENECPEGVRKIREIVDDEIARLFREEELTLRDEVQIAKRETIYA